MKIPLRVVIAATLVAAGLFVLRSFSDGYFQPAPSSQVPDLGKSLYHDRCAMCHGDDGKGKGAAAPFLHPKPRDFTRGIYKIRATESGSIPTDDDLQNTITKGLHGTTMPDWGSFIKGDSLQAIVAYIKSMSPRFTNEQPKPVKIGGLIPSSPSSIESGKKVFDKLQCASCHGTDGTGFGATATDFQDDFGNDIVAANLTMPWTFRGGSTSSDIYMRFRTGMDGTPMPSYIGSATDQEMWNLANYVVSLARKPVWEMNGLEVMRHYESLKQQAKSDPVARGKEIVHTQCVGCHSAYDEKGQMIESLMLAGGIKWSIGPYGYVYSTNLTSDKETGIGNWTDDELKRGIIKGFRKDGSRSIPFPMPWTSFANFTDDDLNAIVSYLRTVPPVHNKLPEHESLNLFSYLWGKFEMLILKKDIPIVLVNTNAGTQTENVSNGEETAR